MGQPVTLEFRGECLGYGSKHASSSKDDIERKNFEKNFEIVWDTVASIA